MIPYTGTTVLRDSTVRDCFVQPESCGFGAQLTSAMVC